MKLNFAKPYRLAAVALIGIIFGLLTIKEGSSVLFSEEGRRAAGNYVPFVLWFNFLAGFAYVAAGVGLWARRVWAVRFAFWTVLRIPPWKCLSRWWQQVTTAVSRLSGLR